MAETQTRTKNGKSVSILSIAEELGILLMEAEARIERSIPVKLGVSFEEARKKLKKST